MSANTIIKLQDVIKVFDQQEIITMLNIVKKNGRCGFTWKKNRTRFF